MKRWIKVQTDLHKKRKLWKLSKDAQLAYFYMLSIAAFDDENGRIPSAEDVSLELSFLKIKPKNMQKIINELLNADILEQKEDGIYVKNWDEKGVTLQ